MKELSEIKKHYHLYVLELVDGKYYIGKTSNSDPYARIKQHFDGFYSAQWVKKYRPVKVTEIIELGMLTNEESDKQELQLTLQYMKKYGYQNVRGGKLNYSGKYIKIGSRYLTKETALTASVVIFLMFVVLFLLSNI